LGGFKAQGGEKGHGRSEAHNKKEKNNDRKLSGQQAKYLSRLEQKTTKRKEREGFSGRRKIKWVDGLYW